MYTELSHKISIFKCKSIEAFYSNYQEFWKYYILKGLYQVNKVVGNG